MPNRQIINGEPYRYAYQGQEKDPETGKEAFQLRLWDSRIGRWLTTDPKGEFSSPYLGMGNNPMRLTDPDGGSTEDWYANSNGELEWHQGSGVREGLLWVASDGTSTADLSRLETWLGGDGNIPGFFSGVGDFFKDTYKTLTTEEGWLGIVRGMEATSMNMDTNSNSATNVEGREVINGTINSFTHALNNFEDYPAYAYGYGSATVGTSYLTRRLSTGYGLSAFGGRIQGFYLNPSTKGVTIFAIQNAKQFKNSAWHFRLDLHLKNFPDGSSRYSLHTHGGTWKYGMSNRKWKSYIETSTKHLIKF